jgi:ribokinase
LVSVNSSIALIPNKMAIPIYVIGSSNTDMVVKVDKLPLPGETVMGGTFFINPGGKGANQAVAAARLGGKVFFVVNIGTDRLGKQALENLGSKENINTTLATVDPDHPSGVALIVVDSKGENTICVAPGSNSFLDKEKVEQALKAATAPSLVLLQMEIPEATIQAAIETAHAKGFQVILNPAPAHPINPLLLKKLYLITPNESEAELLTGIKVINVDSAARAAKHLREQGVSNVVITLGEKGAYLLGENKAQLIPAPPVQNVTDTTAAGDCFNGALALALSENQLLDRAVAFACCAASLSVTQMGAQASMPYRKEVDALFTTFHNSN